MTTTKRLLVDILEEPRGDVYRGLLKATSQGASRFLFVLRSGEALGETVAALLSTLEPHLVSRENVREWPGTRLLDETAEACAYHVNAVTLATIENAAPALYHWLHPDLPEDLCVIRPDGSPLLISISHEHDAYLNITERELDEIQRVVPGLVLALRPESVPTDG